MQHDTPYDLGQIVQDDISGFEGVVTTVGSHISGCTRIGVHRLGEMTDQPDSPGKEHFFFPDQIIIKESSTRWTDLNPVTSVDFDLGQRVRDRSTKFEGRVHIINFNLFNCPQALVYRINDPENNNRWIDQPFVDPLDDHIETPSQTANSQSTGPSTQDSPSPNLSK